MEPPTPLARGAKVNSKYSMGDDAAIRKDAAFQAYLWAMMDKHPTVCRKDWCVMSWGRCLLVCVVSRAYSWVLQEYSVVPQFRYRILLET